MEAEKARNALLDAALDHVIFDGWSQTTFAAAVQETQIPDGLAQALFPRGGVDLARAYHQRGDQYMVKALETSDLSQMRFRDKIAHSVMLRLSFADREAVRRGSALFALPPYSADGAKLIWDTCDKIWTSLGDGSQDVNWYTKRASLTAIYTATVLFWLGDDSLDAENTRDFLDRRISQLMRFEKAKAGFGANPIGKALLAGPLKIISAIRAPSPPPEDLPGRNQPPRPF